MSKLDALCESLKITATSKGGQPIPEGWSRDSHAYKVTLRFQGRRLTTPFYQGSAITADPTPADVVSSLLSDGRMGEQTFREFCSDFGYSDDSRAHERTWKACKRMAPKIRKFLGDAYGAVEKAAEDY